MTAVLKPCLLGNLFVEIIHYILVWIILSNCDVGDRVEDR